MMIIGKVDKLCQMTFPKYFGTTGWQLRDDVPEKDTLSLQKNVFWTSSLYSDKRYWWWSARLPLDSTQPFSPTKHLILVILWLEEFDFVQAPPTRRIVNIICSYSETQKWRKLGTSGVKMRKGGCQILVYAFFLPEGCPPLFAENSFAKKWAKKDKLD